MRADEDRPDEPYYQVLCPDCGTELADVFENFGAAADSAELHDFERHGGASAAVVEEAHAQ